MEQIVIGNPYEISFLHRTQGFKAKMTIAIVNIDHQMSYAGDRCCSDGGSSALSPIQRTADKKNFLLAVVIVGIIFGLLVYSPWRYVWQKQ